MQKAELATQQPAYRDIRSGNTPDLDQIVAIHKQAFSNTFGSKLGKSYLRAFYAWFFTESSALCLVATAERGIVGYVAGCLSAQTYYEQFYGVRQKALRWAALRGVLENPLALAYCHRALPMILPIFTKAFRRLHSQQRTRAQDPPAGPEAYALLNVIAVHPSVLGTPVATTLLHSFVEAVRKADVACIRLSVNKHNSRAIRFYEREGWRSVAETETNFIFQITL